MRRNLMPLTSTNSHRQAHQAAINSHINKLRTMTNMPSRQTPNVVVSNYQADSDDEDYYDDILMDQSSQESEDEYLREVMQKEKKEKGVSDMQINLLPKVLITSKLEGACAICLEQLNQKQEQKVKSNQKQAEPECTVLPCLHKFHSECISLWLKTRNKCPCCNHAVFE